MQVENGQGRIQVWTHWLEVTLPHPTRGGPKLLTRTTWGDDPVASPTPLGLAEAPASWPGVHAGWGLGLGGGGALERSKTGRVTAIQLGNELAVPGALGQTQGVHLGGWWAEPETRDLGAGG